MGRPLVADIVIAGGGIIGLSLGLELRQRGLSVIVLERHHAMQAASWAAGGMLAGRDPENPPTLLPLLLRSLALYPAYLERMQALSGDAIPVRTRRTLQQLDAQKIFATDLNIPLASYQEAQFMVPGLADTGEKFIWLEEASLDPRDICRALPVAFLAEKGTLLEGTPVLSVEQAKDGVVVETPREHIHAAAFVNCCGAWAGELGLGGLPVEPVKGQMATIALAPERLRCVLRTPEFYAIPRGDGRVAIGATVEHAGFDQTIQEPSIAVLLRTAGEFLPEVNDAPRLESWAGLRPGTPDGLPILGAAEMEHCWHATGHYRNGVLLAPATALVMTQLMLGETPDVSLDVFAPSRFV